MPARDSRRRGIEAFIAAVYAEQYGASIGEWAPMLAVSCRRGRLAAAAGYRRASQPLFLERYLDGPVEDAIAARIGEPVDRAEIVEVGHFASKYPGEGRRLMVFLAQHLLAAGCRWVVSTATCELRVLMCRLGLAPLGLAPADPGRLGRAAGAWGRYYDHAPFVVAGNLPRSLAILERGRKA